MGTELDEACIRAGEMELRVVQLQNQVDELHRENALNSCSREELASTLRSQRLSLSCSRADRQRSEEECQVAHAEKVNALNELASERRVAEKLRSQVHNLNQLLSEARSDAERRAAELQRQAQV